MACEITPEREDALLVADRRDVENGVRCPMCGNLGWTLDCNDLGKPGPRMAEFLPCFYPPCEFSGREIQGLSFKGAPFVRASTSPLDGRVMSVSS